MEIQKWWDAQRKNFPTERSQQRTPHIHISFSIATLSTSFLAQNYQSSFKDWRRFLLHFVFLTKKVYAITRHTTIHPDCRIHSINLDTFPSIPLTDYQLIVHLRIQQYSYRMTIKNEKENKRKQHASNSSATLHFLKLQKSNFIKIIQHSLIFNHKQKQRI